MSAQQIDVIGGIVAVVIVFAIGFGLFGFALVLAGKLAA